MKEGSIVSIAETTELLVAHKPVNGLRAVTWPSGLKGPKFENERIVLLALFDQASSEITSPEPLLVLRIISGLELNDDELMSLLRRLSSQGWIRTRFQQRIRKRLWLTPKAYARIMIVYRDFRANFMHSGACRNMDAQMFVPNLLAGEDPMPAINVCRSCPVAVDCLAYSLQTRTSGGIWGGLTPAERVAVNRDSIRKYGLVGTWVRDLGAAHRAYKEYASQRDGIRIDPVTGRAPRAYTRNQRCGCDFHRPPKKLPRNETRSSRSAPSPGKIVQPCPFPASRQGDYDELRLRAFVMLEFLAKQAGRRQEIFLYYRVLTGLFPGPDRTSKVWALVKQVLVNEGWVEIAERSNRPSRWKILPAGRKALAELAD
jgi:WhiB family redox-sensing transcriptional regulator